MEVPSQEDEISFNSNSPEFEVNKYYGEFQDMVS